MDDRFFRASPRPRPGSNYFFPRFPVSTSRRYNPPSSTLSQPLVSPPASSSFTSQPFPSPWQQLSAFSCSRLADIPPREQEEDTSGIEEKIRKRKLAASKGALRKVVETRRPPPRGWRVPTCERAHSLFRFPARYRLSLL